MSALHHTGQKIPRKLHQRHDVDLQEIGLPLGVCLVTGEQGGVRPVLIVQNDTGNRHSPTVIAAAITSQTGKANLPTHISLAARSCGLTRDSVILLEQVRTLDKSRLRERMGRLDEPAMHQVDNAIAVSFGLPQ